MALTKTVTDDKLEVVGDFKDLQIRTATIIKEDGTELSRSFHRRVPVSYTHLTLPTKRIV